MTIASLLAREPRAADAPRPFAGSFRKALACERRRGLAVSSSIVGRGTSLDALYGVSSCVNNDLDRSDGGLR